MAGNKQVLFFIDMVETEEYKNLFSAKLNSDIKEVERIGSGRNSRVYRLVCVDGRIFAAKVYPRHEEETRDRLGTEFRGLTFLWKSGIRNIPMPVSIDRKKGFSIFEFIKGRSVDLGQLDLKDIDQAVEFLITLDNLKVRPDAEKLPPASEAFFSIEDILDNVELRFKRLSCVSPKDMMVRELFCFLEQDFNPFFEVIKGWSHTRLGEFGLAADLRLPISERTLSPSDFGFHNALRRQDGSLVFLDFEYFGWDDPAKMITDFILHPGMALSFSMKERFRNGLLDHFGRSSNLCARLSAVYPIFGLKWCLILLNEFVPVDAARRKFASSTQMDEDRNRAIQLGKARNMLKEVRQTYEEYFRFD